MGHGFHSYGSNLLGTVEPKNLCFYRPGDASRFQVTVCWKIFHWYIMNIWIYMMHTHRDIHIFIYLFRYAHLCVICLIKLEDVPLPSLLKRKYDQYSVLETLCLYTFLSVKAFFGSVKSPCLLGVELGFCSDGKRVSESAAFQCISLDLSEGKATENQVFSNEIWAFPVDFPFRHSIE